MASKPFSLPHGSYICYSVLQYLPYWRNKKRRLFTWSVLLKWHWKCILGDQAINIIQCLEQASSYIRASEVCKSAKELMALPIFMVSSEEKRRQLFRRNCILLWTITFYWPFLVFANDRNLPLQKPISQFVDWRSPRKLVGVNCVFQCPCVFGHTSLQKM